MNLLSVGCVSFDSDRRERMVEEITAVKRPIYQPNRSTFRSVGECGLQLRRPRVLHSTRKAFRFEDIHPIIYEQVRAGDTVPLRTPALSSPIPC